MARSVGSSSGSLRVKEDAGETPPSPWGITQAFAVAAPEAMAYRIPGINT